MTTNSHSVIIVFVNGTTNLLPIHFKFHKWRIKMSNFLATCDYTLEQIALWLVGKEHAEISPSADDKHSWMISDINNDDEYGYVYPSGIVTRWENAAEDFVVCERIQHRLEAFNDFIQTKQRKQIRENALRDMNMSGFVQ